MIRDVTGTMLIPGNCGAECPGNWAFAGWNCCCNECDYMICCLETHDPKECQTCHDKNCPRSPFCME